MNVTRRTFAGSTLAGAIGALLEMKGARAQVSAAKAGICQTCNGNGNCDSKVCGANSDLGQTGVCWPNENPCAGRTRGYFTCKGGEQRCCKLTQSGGTRKCKRV